MTYEKALSTVKSKIKTNYEGVVFTIESTDGKHKYEYTLDDFDIKFNIDDTVKQAVNFCSKHHLIIGGVNLKLLKVAL